ncbi:MAG TPA: SPOR domain-containing protein [Gammaproteobacteria bacterium]|jgi:cell division protein FtsN|nr:SPOR domain-containing protein [Gammaproteobacteria bacterium]
MTRDYKNAPRPKPKRNTKNKKKSDLPGWIWIAGILLVGITIGLIAPRLFGIAQHRIEQFAPAEPAPTATEPAEEKAAAKPESSEPRFDFYKMLPKFQVVIPKQDKSVQSDTGKEPVETPGAYVLQVASFRDYHDADAMEARLALLGLEAHIQQVKIANGETWNRVRIGPISDLAQLNKTRKTLAAHQIEPLLIEVDK